MEDTRAMVLAKEIDPLITAAKLFPVDSYPSYNEALRMAALCVEYGDKWEALYRHEADLAHELHKSLMDRINSKRKPLKAAQDDFSRKARDWRRTEEERARAEAALREAEARKRIEEERLLQASALAARGKAALADAVMERPVEVERLAPAQVAQPSGTSDREAWTFEVTDVERIPREYMMPDLVKIGKMVRALKAGCRIEGVRVYDKGATAFSRK